MIISEIHMKFIKLAFGELYEIITSLRFCLSYDLLNVILSPSKFVYFNENLLVVTDVPMALLAPAESVM